MRRFLLLVIVSSVVYTAVPAVAQRTGDRARILEDIRNTDRAAVESARQWTMEHRVPRRIRQSDGRFVELIATSGGRPVYLASANETSAQVTGTQHLYPGERLGLNLTGDGLEIGIWDGGHVRADHRELSGRVTFGDDAEVTDHATHVAGTLAASGVDRRARGMAYRSDLKSYSWTNDATEMANEASAGMLLSNHSYTVLAGWYYGDLEDRGDNWYWIGDPFISSTEDYAFGWYDVAAVQFDRVAYTNPYFLPVVAAGNDRQDIGPSSGSFRALDDLGNFATYQVSQRPIPPDGNPGGFDTISGAGVAKNVLTVGSIGISTISGRVSTSYFSSFGPVDDGRIKPDVVGMGEFVFSLSSEGTDSYGISSGTSMATPNVAGSLLLLQQYYRDIYGEFMRAATLKGLALHTAADLEAPGPDYHTGWGLLDTEAAAEHITYTISNPVGIVEKSLVDGERFALEITIREPGPVRVTLSWTDLPSRRLARRGADALDASASHLRNDLDLRLVQKTSGRIYEPYVLDPVNPDEPAAFGDNHVDPVEQIYIPNADSGRYTLTVMHKGELVANENQPFSLLVSGAEDHSAPVAVSHLLAEPTLDGITLRWNTLFERTPGTFEVERATQVLGKDADEEFIKVGELSVPGSGSRDYVFTDEYALAGRYSYRIVHVTGSERFIAARQEVNLPAPESYDLLSSFPNPFHETATLVVDLPKSQHVTLEIFDVLGRRVHLALDGELGAGRHRIPVDGGNWPHGVYFARVSTPNGIVVHRMIRQ